MTDRIQAILRKQEQHWTTEEREELFRWIRQCCGRDLEQYAWRCLRNAGIGNEEDAADVVQDALITVLRFCGRYQPPSSSDMSPDILRWIRRFIYYTSLEKVQKLKVRKEELSLSPAAGDDGVGAELRASLDDDPQRRVLDEADWQDREQFLGRMLNELPTQPRAALRTYFQLWDATGEEPTPEAVGKAMGTSYDNARVCLSRARRMLNGRWRAESQ